MRVYALLAATGSGLGYTKPNEKKTAGRDCSSKEVRDGQTPTSIAGNDKVTTWGGTSREEPVTCIGVCVCVRTLRRGP